MQRLVVFFALVIAAVWLFTPGRKELSADEIAAKVRSADLRPYDAGNFPKLFQYLGAARVAGELQSLRREGAYAAAADDRCDQVDLAEFSDETYSSRVLTVFVDCRNGFRIWYSRPGGVIRTKRH